MAAPLKPWEKYYGDLHGVNFQNSTNNLSTGSSTILGDVGGGGGGHNSFVDNMSNPTTQANPGLPPALPPRPSAHQYGNSMMPGRPPMSFASAGGYGYSPAFSSYGSYGMGAPYGQYRGYPSFGSIGANDPFSSSNDAGFIQMAEESSRPAFQSIESIVHAVGSVSMMLESTYFAMFSSFRAVLGVAHHFSQMRTQFAQIFSALAVIRSLRWLYLKVLHLMGVRRGDPNADNVWANIAKEVNASACLNENDLKQARSNWPFVMFIAIVFGTPWIIWKLLKSVAQVANPKGGAAASVRQWMTGDAEHYVAIAQYDFSAESNRELTIRAGQTLRLAPKELQPRVRGWLLASIDGKRAGLVPGNRLRILGKKSGQQQQQQQEQSNDKRIPHPTSQDEVWMASRTSLPTTDLQPSAGDSIESEES